nr:RHS repeat-associated core domain-containing protein [Marinobacter daepoensis]
MVDGHGPEQAEVYYYHLDHLGKPQELTNQQGKLVWSVTYRAYGNVVQQQVAEIDNPLRFQGQYHDPETGLHYNRHRYYNPNTGRFITPDPIGLAGGLNNYQYVPNPTGWVDPLGLAAISKNSPDQITYRGDTRRPEVILEQGFEPKGSADDLYEYAALNVPSIYVSTSKNAEVAIDFATGYRTKPRNIFAVRSDNGIDVNERLGKQSPFPEEEEVAIPFGVKPPEVLGYTPVNKDGSYVGYTVINQKVYGRHE